MEKLVNSLEESTLTTLIKAKLILENSSDVRLQTNYPINRTIGNVMSSDSK